MFPETCICLKRLRNEADLHFYTVPFIKLFSTSVFSTGCEMFMLPKKCFILYL